MPVVTERDARVVLPARYQRPWREPFEEAIRSRLVPGTVVLDIGSGRNPSITAATRPPDVRWIGLDVSEDELRAADPGAYDELVAADVAAPRLPLASTVDLAVSWQVFEHVRPIDQALENVRRALRDGGELVALFSGSRSVFALINRSLPDRVGAAIVGRAMRRRDSDRPVFPAYYDRCHAAALHKLFANWSEVRIEPLYRGAMYFHFSTVLQRAYLAYENTVARRQMANLATHYYLLARR